MGSQLIDRIYESCFAPEIWPDVLDELGRIADAPGASLFVSKDDVLHWVASPEPWERAAKVVREGWLWRGRIVAKLFALRHAGFLIDVERYQPGAAQVAWFRDRVGSIGRCIRKVMVVALARKLLIALWRFVIDGVMPEGAVMKSSI